MLPFTVIVALVGILLVTATTTSTTRTSTDLFRTILVPELFLAHGLRSKDARDATESTVSTATAATTTPTFMCGPLDMLKKKMKDVGSKHKGANAATVYAKKSEQRGCFVTHLGTSEAAAEHAADPAWSVAHMPPALKIHATVVQYLSFFTQTQKQSQPAAKSVSRHAQPRREGPARQKDAPTEEEVAEGAVVTIEFLPGATNRAIADAVAGILATLTSPSELLALQATFPSSPGLTQLHARLTAAGVALSADATTTCALPAHATVSLRRASAEVANLRGLGHACVLALAQAAAMAPSVLRVALAARPRLLNYEARGVVQTGKMGEEAYRAAGITGKGQVCGIADSGLDDLSCFFLDTSGKYHTAITNRSGAVQRDRRKVIQYVGYADGVDDQGGHGTHVAGSVAGKSLSDFASVDGMAPDAKISFFDIGVLGSEYLKVRLCPAWKCSSPPVPAHIQAPQPRHCRRRPGAPLLHLEMPSLAL